MKKYKMNPLVLSGWELWVSCLCHSDPVPGGEEFNLDLHLGKDNLSLFDLWRLETTNWYGDITYTTYYLLSSIENRIYN